MHLLLVGDVDDVAVAEHVGAQLAVQAVFIVVGHVGVPGLLAGDEGGVRHTGHGGKPALNGLGLLVGEAVVHEGDDGVLPLENLQVHVGVVGHQGKGAHNQQAGHGDAHGGKGHKAVGQHIAAALAEKVSDILHASTSYVPTPSPMTVPRSSRMTRLRK